MSPYFSRRSFTSRIFSAMKSSARRVRKLADRPLDQLAEDGLRALQPPGVEERGADGVVRLRLLGALLGGADAPADREPQIPEQRVERLGEGADLPLGDRRRPEQQQIGVGERRVLPPAVAAERHQGELFGRAPLLCELAVDAADEAVEPLGQEPADGEARPPGAVARLGVGAGGAQVLAGARQEGGGLATGERRQQQALFAVGLRRRLGREEAAGIERLGEAHSTPSEAVAAGGDAVSGPT